MHAFIQKISCKFAHRINIARHADGVKAHMHFLVRSEWFQHQRYPDSSTCQSRLSALKQPHQTSVYLRPAGYGSPQRAGITERGSGCNTSEVLQQQAAAARANDCSSLASPAPGAREKKKKKEKRTSLVLPPALRFVCTHTHKNTRRKRERGEEEEEVEWSGGGGGLQPFTPWWDRITCREKRPTIVLLTDTERSIIQPGGRLPASFLQREDAIGL